MSSMSFRSSRPDRWVEPRQSMDPTQRMMRHGPVQPMHKPSFFARLLGLD
ncbi:hypothetical protein [Erythrobacter sp. HKB08]|nr:hypothetical protein [Erythrobacter sp. HKB08]